MHKNIQRQRQRQKETHVKMCFVCDHCSITADITTEFCRQVSYRTLHT